MDRHQCSSPIAAAFWDNVQVGDDLECWPYVGPGSRGRYGHTRVVYGGRRMYAHRVAYMLAGGIVDVEHDIVRHSCDVGYCVNPHHLLRGNIRTNVQDREDRNRRTPFLPRGPENWSSKLTERDVVAIRKAHELGVRVPVLAECYGVSGSTVFNVLSRRHYGEVVSV
jgi:hypothetical protein